MHEGHAVTPNRLSFASASRRTHGLLCRFAVKKMSNIGRGVFLAGVGLFVRAAYCVIQARHALRQSGGHLDDFVLPWNVVLLVVVAAAACLAGGLKSLSGFKPIHLAEGETACWDRLHERFNFRLYATRAACVSRLVQNFVTPPPA